ncbi:hypothetical protein Tamer19_06630 [Cupriavidus sp. TA19]|nr:hypothetical protein Tamer19_06630 [Cupriavidus sp. TA19]
MSGGSLEVPSIGDALPEFSNKRHIANGGALNLSGIVSDVASNTVAAGSQIGLMIDLRHFL